jgi:hypothetical protein
MRTLDRYRHTGVCVVCRQTFHYAGANFPPRQRCDNCRGLTPDQVAEIRGDRRAAALVRMMAALPQGDRTVVQHPGECLCDDTRDNHPFCKKCRGCRCHHHLPNTRMRPKAR